MEQLTPLLEELAKTLGTTAENLWRVLIQQVGVEIRLCELWMNIALWGGIILIILGVVLFFIGIIHNGNREDRSIWSDDTGYGISATGIFVIMFALIICGCIYYSNYSDLLTLHNNPEYWALQQILNTIKHAK